MKPHYDWFCQLKAKHPDAFTPKSARELIHQDVAEIFAHILEDAGVYKNTQEGQKSLPAVCRCRKRIRDAQEGPKAIASGPFFFFPCLFLVPFH